MPRPKKKNPNLKPFTVTFTTTGRGTCTVMAESREDAREKFDAGDFVDKSDEQGEWEMNEFKFKHAEEDR